MLLDERSLWPRGMFVTGHLVAHREFLQSRPELVKAWLRAHIEVTRAINANPAWARQVINKEIKRYTGMALPEEVLTDAWGRLNITYDPVCASLYQSAQWAYELGFLGQAKPDLKGIYDLRLLNQLLKEKGLPAVK